MFHLVAFTESHDNVANQDLTPVPDGIMTIQNNHYLLQRNWNIIYAAFMALTAQRCRIVTPGLRQITLPFITPIIGATLPANTRNVADYRTYPFRLRALEELAAEATHTTAGGTRSTVLLALSQSALLPAPQGDVYTMRGTSVTAATVNAWSLLSVTWADTLPSGLYAACGLRVQSTNAQAARLIFEDQVNRPGTMSGTGLTDDVHPMFIKGGLGELGRFTGNRMPSVEVLCNVADAAHEILLDIVRIG